MTKPQRRVVCAANRVVDEDLVIGARHFDSLMHGRIARINEERRDWEYIEPHEWEQGFIDQWGVFMTREEAWKVAEAAGQIRYRCGGDGVKLFSENLY